MNMVALVGNLASEPQLRQTGNGRAVCTFRVAVSRVGGEQADFFTVVAWERQAEVCQEFLTLGRRVGIEGRLHHSTWEAAEGRRSKVEVVAHRVELLGNRPRSEADTRAAAEAIADDPFAVEEPAAELVPA